MDDELQLKVRKVTEAYDSFVLDHNLIYTNATNKARQMRNEKEQLKKTQRGTDTGLLRNEETMIKKRRTEME